MKSVSRVDHLLGLLSSVKLGIWLMIVVIGLALLGTLIPQVTRANFDQLYGRFTPAERALLSGLGLFDLYHAWWFEGVMIVLALNLTLFSIDSAARAWSFLKQPELMVTPTFVAAQSPATMLELPDSERPIERVETACRNLGYRVRVTTSDQSTTVFAERGAWIRFGGLVVHVSLLVILGAAFIGRHQGYEGALSVSPGQTASDLIIPGSKALGQPDRRRPLPFTVVGNKIWVELKDPRGPLVEQNVVNWYSDVTIKDGNQERRAVVSVNQPYDYRGYRFFQSGSGRGGDAGRIVLGLTLQTNGSERQVAIEKNQTVTIDGFGAVRFVRFLSDIRIAEGKPQSVSEAYNNPAAELEITLPSGEKKTKWVFSAELTDFLQRVPDASASALTVNGVRLVLVAFDKVGQEHIVHVQYDPGMKAVYLGFIILVVSLVVVLSVSHERLWVVIESQGESVKLHFGGNANRHQAAFEKKFHALVERLSDGK
jgi:cytochrome c biogenesis protein